MPERRPFQTDQILHGGDYNPEQWLEHPRILEQDVAMLKKARCNTVTLGVFSWSMLEPEEGKYTFDWLEQIVDRLWTEGIRVILATPSGARPKWLADRYPEVLRWNADGTRRQFGTRHNHCYTSPVYRRKTAAIDRELARRFGGHPAVILWHISNELGGECYCPLCQEAFRGWLKNRYKTIEELNRRWNTVFWSHVYNDFAQVEAPSPNGEDQLHGLNLDWKRFVTYQTADFLRSEIRALGEYSDLPVTTNLMYYFYGLDYFRLVREIDVVSWDTYPTWHKGPESATALENGMCHDLMRSLKDQPFLQMESCPSSTNWQKASKLKRPGLLKAQALQAVAHGGDAAMYFQIRQSPGGPEKFHGAVIDHYGGEDTRVFREVSGIGKLLEQLAPLAGSRFVSEAVMLYDWESIWAMEDSQGPRNCGLHYRELLLHFYRALRRCGIGVDLKDEERLMQPGALEGCRLLILPMGYLFRNGFAETVEQYVRGGGTLLVTFWSGIADENDRCFTGGVPHGLCRVLGLRSSEIDALYDGESNRLVPTKDSRDNDLDLLQDAYTCRYLCDLPVPLKTDPEEAASGEPGILLEYGADFYEGTPALTCHSYGNGEAWYLAAYAEERLYEDLVLGIARKTGIGTAGREESGLLPEGLEITEREGNGKRFRVIQNFSAGALDALLPGKGWNIRALSDGAVYDREQGRIRGIPRFGYAVCEKHMEKGESRETCREKHIW